MTVRGGGGGGGEGGGGSGQREGKIQLAVVKLEVRPTTEAHPLISASFGEGDRRSA